jgi:hypothetical protein
LKEWFSIPKRHQIKLEFVIFTVRDQGIGSSNPVSAFLLKIAKSWVLWSCENNQQSKTMRDKEDSEGLIPHDSAPNPLAMFLEQFGSKLRRVLRFCRFLRLLTPFESMAGCSTAISTR